MRAWTQRVARGLILSCALASISGCKDDDAGTEPDEQKEHEHPTDGPLYLFATRFEAGDQIETYLVTTDSLNKDTELDPTDGPKLLGGIVPLTHDGVVYAPDSNGPVILRYEADEHGKLAKKNELSFSGVGITEIQSWHIWIVNDTKGYVFDPTGERIVLWNPKTMTLSDKEIDLASLAREGFVPNLVLEHSGPHERGDQLLIPLGWTDQDGNSRYASGVLVLDTAKDEVLEVAEDERCGETYTSFAAKSGDVYFFPPDWSSAQHFFAENHRPTCSLRIREGDTKFDADFELDFSALGSGSAASGIVPDGDAGFFFTSADEKLWAEREDNGDSYWRVWHYNFDTKESRQVESLPEWSGQLYYVNVGGESFIPHWRETDTGYRTTLYHVDGSRDPEESVSFDASWMGVLKLR